MTAFTIGRDDTGRTLAAVVRIRCGLSWAKVKTLIAAGGVWVQGRRCGEVARRMKPGERVELRNSPTAPTQARKPTSRRNLVTDRTGSIAIVYVDDDLVIVDKPPGITTVRSAADIAEFGPRGQKFLPPTLADRLAERLPGRVIAVHRLDRDTSGLVAFARNPTSAKQMGRQFREHTVEREYRAIVRGRPPERRVETWLVRDRGDGRRGSGPPGAGERAVTQVRVVRELGPLTLVACRLETGRTHQVRIHLGELGCPIAGERVYDRPPNGAPYPDPSGARRTALHAAILGLSQPTTGERLRWESPLPDDMQALTSRFRSESGTRT